MSLDTTMVSIHPHFTIKDGKMDQCIALLEEILVLTKANERRESDGTYSA